MRLLIVGMAESIHLAKWITMLGGRGWDIHLFPAHDAPPHPQFRDITVHDLSGRVFAGVDPSVRMRDVLPVAIGPVGRQVRRRLDRAGVLARLIERLRPDIVHSQEFQHAAYLTLAARQRLGARFPPWIVTSWGSDIYLFGRTAEHAATIRDVLAAADFFACECERDIELAHAFGFRGETLPVIPIAGGYELAELRPLRAAGPTSSRRVIALKGYQSWAGRALVGLRAIELCGQALAGYRLDVYLATLEVAAIAGIVGRSIGLDVNIVSRLGNPVPYEEILRMQGRSRASIGLSISDAISTSFLETILMGSFPIQSFTGCANEWVEDGVSGSLVPPEDPDAVAAALRHALADDALVDRAAALNAATAEARLAMAVVQPKAIALYEQVAAHGPFRRSLTRATVGTEPRG